ncbi:Potassium channel domain [Trinorchestia longiramus]|nr:Potassium channel domain [Trinorchestia longiramus]
MEVSQDTELLHPRGLKKTNKFKNFSIQKETQNDSHQEMSQPAQQVTSREKISNRWKKFTVSSKFKKGSRYCYLLVAFVFYTAVGAKIFQALEQDLALQEAQQRGDDLLRERRRFMELLLGSTNSSFGNVTELAEGLALYEAAVAAAADTGVQVLLQVQVRYCCRSRSGATAGPGQVLLQVQVRCCRSRSGAAAGPGQVLLQVHVRCCCRSRSGGAAGPGYGDIAPATVWGRVFCIGFALLGIPLSLSFIAATGDLLASIAAMLPVQSLAATFPKGRRRTVMAGVGTVVLLLGFIAVGGLMFHLLEDWQFLDAFYFCFITTTTIGFGDFVPSPASLRYCTAYIMLGLAITSTVIELVRRQYAQSWARMQELSSRLHYLSSPLAIAIRKMALTGATEMDVDPELMRQLRDINLAMAAEDVSDEDNAWDALISMAEKKKRITIVMYESAV